MTVSGFGAVVKVKNDRLAVSDNLHKENGVYVFEWQEDEWGNPFELKAPNQHLFGVFGNTIEIFNEYILVGSKESMVMGNEGHVFIYELKENWELIYTLSSPDNPYNFGDGFGQAIYARDNLIVICSPFAEETIGEACYIYQFKNGKWSISKINQDSFEATFFGTSTAVEKDIMVIGAQFSDTKQSPYAGAIYIYEK